MEPAVSYIGTNGTKKVSRGDNMNESLNTILFTPAALLDFLSSIDELKDVDVGITESPEGDIQVQIGDSIYNVDTSQATEIEVDEEVVDQVDEANEEAYDELDVDTQDDVEGGIIKEALKTLLVGGLVRMGAKVLKE